MGEGDKRRRAGLPSSLDTFTTCPNRTMPKLSSIDIDGRSTEETNAWKQVLEHATKQARVRAVQLHLDCISALQALPVSFSCCGQKPLVAASAYYKGSIQTKLKGNGFTIQAQLAATSVGIL